MMRDFLTKKRRGTCDHSKAIPDVKDSDLDGLSAEQVRKRFPRYSGPCPECGKSVIAYASSKHYIAGDW